MRIDTNIPGGPLPRFMVRHRLLLVLAAHGLLFAVALLAAFALAFNFQHFSEWFVPLFLPLVAVAVPIKLLMFRWTRQYQGSWRYVGLRDLFSVISASLVATFFFLIAYFLLENGWRGVTGNVLIDRSSALPQSSVFALDWAATIVFVSAARILVRFYYEDIHPKRTRDPRRVLIVGAGDNGEALLRELLRMPDEHYHCVGFLDDQVAELHGRIHDVEIVGRTTDLRRICEEQGVQEVLIALPYASPKLIRRLVAQCGGIAVLFRTIPTVRDMIEGRVRVSQIRDVDIGDLLGREPVELDSAEIARQLKGQRVVVTGAGGSIGSEMCRQIASFQPARLILVEQAENALFLIERELRASRPALSIVARVADIADRNRVEAIFAEQRPSIVFHAAAHKHVPMMEVNPGEAIKNNVGGTIVVAECALAHAVGKMVLISTDKAVNPTSMMGCSKRIAEMYVQGLSGRGETHFVTVRFGNVLGSSGSVVPIFREQIANGGPVTVTHPDMVRYFMTIPEAAQLVLQAGAMGKGGEIYVLHMGEPVKIVDLARDMITLSGLRPGQDIEIAFTGRRPGEKLYEELSHEGEHIGDTAHPKIGIWKHRAEDFDSVRRGIDLLLESADTADAVTLQARLKELVPEYSPEGCSGIPPTPSLPVQSPLTA